jgi:hypothetical protein
VGLAFAVGAAIAVAVLWSSGRPGPNAAVTASAFRPARQTTPLTSAGRRRLRAGSWWGHVYTASTGELVNVSVSNSYPVDEAVGQGWADYFAGLVHGAELQLLHVFVATPAEVQATCGSQYAIGCYGSNEMEMIGEPVFGIDPKEVAAHEYGHHVAHNRVNPPWVAEDWGTKRWASYAGICARAAQGTAFPGDEDAHYRLNPGEGFAEVYRALVDSKRGSAFDWSTVDASFIPNQTALQAVEDDVLQPWTAPRAAPSSGRWR